ncbi:single-stranded DNA-binding protein [Microcystis sp. M42BS1]|uniref:single-stranded DNA-binding protein n=1 Tax=Microcystis sp. M42BS1 TaxID=2771192 RepID=UPI00258D5799|nr:single-stranded DNA-binding protein [Microcystis sp. M42BS1]MCA2570686.1 single-stranded DNA-binding protein [Microcystis sp. M42BS1]
MIQASFAGYVGNNPEIRYTADQKKVVNFSVAIRMPKNQTQWVRISTWGQLAEIAEMYIKTGQFVAVSGTLTLQNWVDGSGTKQTSLQCTASSITLGPSKVGNEEKTPEPAIETPAVETKKPVKKAAAKKTEKKELDEIPF